MSFPSLSGQEIERLERRIALLEEHGGLSQLREKLAINVGNDVLIAAALEANERTGGHLDAGTAGAFTQIVVDVINRYRG